MSSSSADSGPPSTPAMTEVIQLSDITFKPVLTPVYNGEATSSTTIHSGLRPESNDAPSESPALPPEQTHIVAIESDTPEQQASSSHPALLSTNTPASHPPPFAIDLEAQNASHPYHHPQVPFHRRLIRPFTNFNNINLANLTNLTHVPRFPSFSFSLSLPIQTLTTFTTTTLTTHPLLSLLLLVLLPFLAIVIAIWQGLFASLSYGVHGS